jgi:hypothetical protein
MSGEDLFWELAAPLMTDAAVTRWTMMGFPCLRYRGRFFASTDRSTGALLVKLPAARVTELIAAEHGQPFAPGWAHLPRMGRHHQPQPQTVGGAAGRSARLRQEHQLKCVA